MANEVDLVVRARNEATKAIDSVAAAVKGLRGAQDDLNKSAEKSSGPLGRFVEELNNLKKEAQGLQSLGKVGDTLTAITTRATRTEGAVNKTAKALSDLTNEAARAAAKTAEFKAQTDAAEKALARETKAARELRKEQTAANNAATKAADKLKSLQTTQAKTPAVDLSSKIADQEKVLAAALVRQKEATAAYQAQDKARRDSLASQRTLNTAIKEAVAEETRLRNAILSTEAAHAKNQRAAGAARDSLAASKTVANDVATAFGAVATSEDKLAEASAAMAAQIQRVTELMERQRALDARATTVDRAQPRGLDTQVAVQRETVAKMRAAMESAQAEAGQLAAAINKVATPTREMVNQLSNAVVVARQAAQAFNTESQALFQLERALRAQQLAGFTAANKQAASSAKDTATQVRAASVALSEGGRGGGIFKSALAGIYGEGRQALSLMQRLRGEVLSLTAAYVGFQAAVQGISQVVNAFRAMEAAQNRLGAVFSQDTQKVSQEIAFLRGQAQRLGIEFSTLSDEYAKFAVATNAAGFAQESIRKIFLSVAEAARVNKLTNDQLQGTFLALQQMASKGKVSAQELQQQLGERLPGAVTIFAQALGKTNAELIKMQETGSLLANESNLLAFADELNKRFGPQLQTSLQSTSAEIGRFQNSLFGASLQVAAGGFIQSFTELLRSMNAVFASQEGVKFFLGLGAALGRITDGVKLLVENFGLLRNILIVIVSTKITSFLASLIGSLRSAQTAAVAATGAQSAFAAETAIVSGSINGLKGSLASLAAEYRAVSLALAIGGNNSKAAAVGFTVMRGSLMALRSTVALAATGFRLLWGAIGGIPGLIITGITLGVGQWLTSVNDTTSALEEHKRILTAVIAGYGNLKDKTGDWAKEIKGATLSQAIANAKDLESAYISAIDKAIAYARQLTAWTSDLPTDNLARQQAAQVVALFDELRSGVKTIDEVTTALDKIATTGANEDITKIATELLNMLNKVGSDGTPNITELGQAFLAAQATVNAFKNTATEADKVILGVSASAAKSEDALRAATEEGAKKFAEALGELNKAVPKLAEELKKIEAIKALEEQYKQAIRFARSIGEATAAYKAFQAGVTSINTPTLSGDAMQSTIQLLKDREGFQPVGTMDRNAYRAGYGSDTVTLSDGTIEKVTKGMRVTREDADRDLVRRIGEFQNVVKEQIGEDRFNSFNPQQQAVLTSIAYNYGDLASTGKLSTFREGSVTDIVAAIESLKTHNEGINANRRQIEANIFGGGATSASADAEQLARAAEAAKKKADAAKEYNKEAAESDLLIKDQLANEGKISKEMAIQQAVNAEIAKAKEAGTIPDPQHLQNIRDLTAAEWERNNALKANKTEITEGNRLLGVANALNSQRAALETQLKAAQAAGNTALVTEFTAKLTETNTQLTEAIRLAREFWTTQSGPQADAAIAKLDTLGIKQKQVSTQMSYFGLNVSQIQTLVGSFADGLSNAFANFVTAVAQGQNAMKALKTAFLQFAADFLREIATMILKQMILNALSGMGGPIGTAATALLKTGHTGGVVGSGSVGAGNMSKRVSPAVFAGARRYHTGGIAGLRPDEMPIIAKRGEEMLTEQDPRHRNNGGMAGSQPAALNIRSVLVMDPEVGRSIANSADNEKAVLGFIRKNKMTVKQALR